ncbi:MAG: polysaccharide deacetylase family protein [Spirochaetes bacterium]|nr:polysaccharide deacetylase family protein [Spirochaetota bacterium]
MIQLRNLPNRVANKYHKILGDRFARRVFIKTTSTPYISFSFDDFPHSAFTNGSSVLEKYGVHGTFFVSMGLLGTETASGRIATIDDIDHLIKNEHEIGCHTFHHYDGWSTNVKIFEQSVIDNLDAFQKIYPEGCLKSFAYPIHGPKPKVKRVIGRHFLCCRGGGQTVNDSNIDLNLLNAFFLDWRNCDNMEPVMKLIERNSLLGGWLIFVTHDVTTQPSQYGCTIKYFNEVVCHSIKSGATILPIARICQELGIS